jgi:hypothetical protein
MQEKFELNANPKQELENLKENSKSKKEGSFMDSFLYQSMRLLFPKYLPRYQEGCTTLEMQSDKKEITELMGLLEQDLTQSKDKIVDGAYMKKLEQSLDNTPYRQIIMNYPELLQEQELYFVYFNGIKKNLSLKQGQKLWQTDNNLINMFNNYPNILSYTSKQVQESGNWDNLVIFKSKEAIQQWRNSFKHLLASYHISPQVFQQIRLQIGSINLADKTFEIDRTKQYFYDK